MTRTRRALVAAGFAYAQFLLALVSGLILVPLSLGYLGARQYGLWLASGELLAYLALADAGVFTVLPWLVAAADGRGDLEAIRGHLVHALVVGILVSVVILAAGAGIWYVLPGLLQLPAADRALLEGPLVLLVVGTAVNYPLKAFCGLLLGLQDNQFIGRLVLVQTVLTIGLTVGLLVQGQGLYALAAAASLPPLLGSVAVFVRCRRLCPECLRNWPRPTLAGCRTLFREGVGAWLGGFGNRLINASNGLILLFLGHPEGVTIYACTAKLGQLLQQTCWILPDSGLVGLAQLHGEGTCERLRAVVCNLLRVHLLLAGGGAALLLMVNPGFVGWWVGADYFGGALLNILLAVALITASLSHGLVTTVAVAGWRFQVGAAALLQGALYVPLALWLGGSFGLPGLPAAFVFTEVVVSVCWAVVLQRAAFDLSAGQIGRRVLWPWAVRLLPVLAAAGLTGVALRTAPLWLTAVVSTLAGAVCLWWVRPLFDELPLPARLERWLVRVGLLSRPLEPVGASAPGAPPDQYS
jgi:O-antigen/teichoic acid export membrane protein